MLLFVQMNYASECRYLRLKFDCPADAPAAPAVPGNPLGGLGDVGKMGKGILESGEKAVAGLFGEYIELALLLPTLITWGRCNMFFIML
jgi:hypothetical protein